MTAIKWNKAIKILIAVCLVFLAVFLALALRRPVEVRDVDVSFAVSDNIGVDLNATALTFGRLTPGSAETRTIELTNPYDYPLKIRVSVTSSVRQFISTQDREILAKPYETLPVYFIVNVPANASFQNHTGVVRFEFLKA